MPTTTELPPLVRVRSRPDLDDALRTLGTLQTRAESLKLNRARREAEVKARFEKAVHDAETAAAEQIERIRAYVGANRDLVFGLKRRVVTQAGQIALRQLPVRVHVTDEQAALDYLQAEEPAYLRQRVELDKRALAEGRPGVPGIEYSAGDQLVLIPITSGDKITIEL